MEQKFSSPRPVQFSSCTFPKRQSSQRYGILQGDRIKLYSTVGEEEDEDSRQTDRYNWIATHALLVLRRCDTVLWFSSSSSSPPGWLKCAKWSRVKTGSNSQGFVCRGGYGTGWVCWTHQDTFLLLLLLLVLVTSSRFFPSETPPSIENLLLILTRWSSPWRKGAMEQHSLNQQLFVNEF